MAPPLCAMAAAVAATSADDDDDTEEIDTDKEIVIMVSMRGRNGSSGIVADTVTPAGASKVTFKRPLTRQSLEINLFHVDNGHIGSSMVMRPHASTPDEGHGRRILEWRSRAGGLAPPLADVHCYRVSEQAAAPEQDLHPPPPPSRPPLPPPSSKRRRRHSNSLRPGGGTASSSNPPVVIE